MNNNFKLCPFCRQYIAESDYKNHLYKEKEEEAEYKRQVLNGKYNYGYTSLRRAMNIYF